MNNSIVMEKLAYALIAIDGGIDYMSALDKAVNYHYFTDYQQGLRLRNALIDKGLVDVVEEKRDVPFRVYTGNGETIKSKMRSTVQKMTLTTRGREALMAAMELHPGLGRIIQQYKNRIITK